jgi:hypothetical protein
VVDCSVYTHRQEHGLVIKRVAVSTREQPLYGEWSPDSCQVAANILDDITHTRAEIIHFFRAHLAKIPTEGLDRGVTHDPATKVRTLGKDLEQRDVSKKLREPARGDFGTRRICISAAEVIPHRKCIVNERVANFG